MAGSVVTFYSYKGGVGRSFALANIAVLLGRWGFHVLCIDWDLEAPGLAHFFGSVERGEGLTPSRHSDAKGLVELLTDFRAKKEVPLQWRDYVIRLDGDRTVNVSLLKAGRVDGTYTRRLHKLNWRGLYRSGLGGALETMFEELRQEYDYVLIDARTGVTDFSGIITAQLPDILAFLFTANEQSFEGATDVARRAAAARNELAIDRSRLLLLPIPARFEIQLEHKISVWWRERFARELTEFYEPWATRDLQCERLVQSTTIPYVPIWSFGERLSVVEDSSNDPLGINYSLETIAALLAHRLGQTRLLLDSRDEFVSSARRIAQKRDQSGYSIFLSYAREDATIASALARSLEQRGLRTFLASQQIIQGALLDDVISEGIDRSAHMVVLVGERRGGKWQEYEIRTFLRQATTDEGTRLLIPVVLHDRDPAEIPSLLRQYRVLSLRGNFQAAADEVLRLIQPTVKSVEKARSILEVCTTADDDIPVDGATVCALAKNGTTIGAVTGPDGRALLKLLEGQVYTLLIAHPMHPARIIDEFNVENGIHIRLFSYKNVGSLIIHTTGYIPGLKGSLNPICDTLNRLYLYADNIAVDGGKPQPIVFTLNKPFDLEDAGGSRFEVSVKHIAGRTSLLEYRQLA